MTGKHPNSASRRQAVATADPKTDAQKDVPRLRMFGVDVGVVEVELRKRITAIGRSSQADIKLPNRSVSRAHATITREESIFTLTDTNSTSGTTVNGTPIDSHILQDGDQIEIAMYTLQYCTQQGQEGAAEAAAQAKTLLRADYCALPSTMEAKYRVLEFNPLAASDAGGTLAIGQGGLLILTLSPPKDGSCLELEMTIGRRAKRQFLGEIMGVIEKDGTHWMCVKLHTVSRATHEIVVAGAKPGEWIDVPAT